MGFSKFMRRARSSTKSLLGDAYEESVVDNPSAPKPPEDISAYSEDRLKLGLQFADHSLRNKKRRVSPIAHHCLTIYKATLKAILDEEYADKDEKKELLSHVLLCEKSIYSHRFLRLPAGGGELKLVERLAQLRRFEFAARYGDYLAAVCEDLKVKAKIEGTKYFEQLHGWDRYWTDINDDINKEHPLWRKWQVRDPAIAETDVKTTLAVFNACNTMGLNFDRLLQTIAMYADRNSLVHSSIARVVERGQWHHLEEVLATDLVDIPVVTPGHLRGNIPFIQETVEAVIDTYFDRKKAHPADPIFWMPKEEVYERITKLKMEKEKKYEAVLAERKLIEKKAAERCQKLIADHSLIHLTAAMSGIEAPSGRSPDAGPSKRQLSEAEKAECVKTFKRRKAGFDKLINLHRECHKQLKAYKDEYGNTEPPIDPRLWMDLGEAEEE